MEIITLVKGDGKAIVEAGSEAEAHFKSDGWKVDGEKPAPKKKAPAKKKAAK